MQLKSVFVTGANRGIGLEFVKQLVKLPEPPSVIFASCRDPTKAEELKKISESNSSVKIIQMDIKDHDKFPQIRQQLEQEISKDGLNLLINNAGLLVQQNLSSVTKEAMMESFEVNAVSPLLLAKELLPLLKTAVSKSSIPSMSAIRSGIVNITSKMGSIDDNTSGSHYPYRTSKTALNMITKSLAVDLKTHGIVAFVLHPGWVATDMGGKNAPINTRTSVEGMLNVILTATEESCGGFFNYDGANILW
uniref:C-factor n=2 Tax=Parasteatoda tepidariorum TaxID=114398 RepID=A0A2L2XY92_PARTP